ncbi:MAG: hypothetical protein DDT30_01286 [Dehalococcoidia bacterium]|nr:hypothetical protein [Bacillota bacterium]
MKKIRLTLAVLLLCAAARYYPHHRFARYPEHNDSSAGFTVTVTLPKTSKPSASPQPGTVPPGTEITLTSATASRHLLHHRWQPAVCQQHAL